MQRQTPGPMAVAEAVAARQQELSRVLSEVTPEDLTAPSLLPGWDRLTIVCHLRFGAEANMRMTSDALVSLPTSYYPGGRELTRPQTLLPRPQESARDVVVSLGTSSQRLESVWAGLSELAWDTIATEPAGQHDLGLVTLGQLAVLRLTEVEVHGTDLDLGLGEWSDVFTSVALSTRLLALPTRRSNHQPVDGAVQGTWRLSTYEGSSFVISVDGSTVTSAVADIQGAPKGVGHAIIRGSERDLVAMLLGRPTTTTLELGGNVALARRFNDAFPPP